MTQVFEMVREHNFSFLVSRRMELDLSDIISALNALECICILLCCKAYLARAYKRRRPSTIPIAFLEGVSWYNCDQSTAICCMQNYNRSQQYVTDLHWCSFACARFQTLAFRIWCTTSACWNTFAMSATEGFISI